MMRKILLSSTSISFGVIDGPGINLHGWSCFVSLVGYSAGLVYAGSVCWKSRTCGKYPAISRPGFREVTSHERGRSIVSSIAGIQFREVASYGQRRFKYHPMLRIQFREVASDERNHRQTFLWWRAEMLIRFVSVILWFLLLILQTRLLLSSW